MNLLNYLEIRHFKRFDSHQRIELDHPTVLIGPNNCGKTTAIQAIALWSQAVKTWFAAKGASPPRQRTATALNRLSILSVPVRQVRYLWSDAEVRSGTRNIPLEITLGIESRNSPDIEPVTMQFRSQGDDIIYCTPDEATLNKPKLIEAAAGMNVQLLYPMSGLETEEPILQPGRIDVLLGQGQTAQVLRNLCLMVFRNAPDDWQRIAKLVSRLFSVALGEPTETGRGSIDLAFKQEGAKRPFDIALAGRGLQQMLLVFAYLHVHRRSVLLIDEPDAHLEILRQKQVYVLLRDIAAENASQVVLVTHSEVILDEALDGNLVLLLDGKAEALATKPDIRNALRYFGADHYVRARERGYVLYVEGSTDVDLLRALAERLRHPVAGVWDERINSFYLRNNHPGMDLNAALKQVEGGFDQPPQTHFRAMRSILPRLRGLAIRDSDGQARNDSCIDGLEVVYWQRYEIENYVVTPDTLRAFVVSAYSDAPLFREPAIESAADILDSLIQERIFNGSEEKMTTWKNLPADGARLLWEAQTRQLKLSEFAETFFRHLADAIGGRLLLRKRDLYRLVRAIPKLRVGD